MNEVSLDDLIKEYQEKQSCFMCEGSHGNNTLCQSSYSSEEWEI